MCYFLGDKERLGCSRNGGILSTSVSPRALTMLGGSAVCALVRQNPVDSNFETRSFLTDLSSVIWLDWSDWVHWKPWQTQFLKNSKKSLIWNLSCLLPISGELLLSFKCKSHLLPPSLKKLTIHFPWCFRTSYLLVLGSCHACYGFSFSCLCPSLEKASFSIILSPEMNSVPTCSHVC